MLHKTEQLATVLALTAATGARALPLSEFNGTTLEVFVSGASAQDQGIERFFRLQCAVGTLDVWRGPSGSNTAQQLLAEMAPSEPALD